MARFWESDACAPGCTSAAGLLHPSEMNFQPVSWQLDQQRALMDSTQNLARCFDTFLQRRCSHLGRPLGRAKEHKEWQLTTNNLPLSVETKTKRIFDIRLPNPIASKKTPWHSVPLCKTAMIHVAQALRKNLYNLKTRDPHHTQGPK